jgi:hypothetical protein
MLNIGKGLHRLKKYITFANVINNLKKKGE